MRLSTVCIGGIILFSTLHPALAIDPTGEDKAVVAQEVAEMKQRVEKLAAQIERLERQLEIKREAEQAPLTTYTYKVSDIVPTIVGDFAVAHDFNHLIHYITTKIAPEQWEKAGGRGSLAPYPQNLSLVVSQTAEVHEEIKQWMTRVREAKSVLADFHKTTPPERAAKDRSAASL